MSRGARSIRMNTPGNARYSRRDIAKLPEGGLKTFFGLKCRSLKRKRRQTERDGAGCVVLPGKPVQRPGLLEPAQTSFLSTKSTHKTAKAPVSIFPELSVERIFVFGCLVEKMCPPQKGDGEILSSLEDFA